MIITAVTNHGRDWENLKIGAILVEAVGFIILVSGNMIYNEIIELPWLKNAVDDEKDSNQVSLQEKKRKNRGSNFKSDASDR